MGKCGGEWVMNIDKVFTDTFLAQRKIKKKRQNCQEAYEAKDNEKSERTSQYI